MERTRAWFLTSSRSPAAPAAAPPAAPAAAAAAVFPLAGSSAEGLPCEACRPYFLMSSADGLRNVRSPALVPLHRWSNSNIGSPGPSTAGAEHIVPGMLLNAAVEIHHSLLRYGVCFGHYDVQFRHH